MVQLLPSPTIARQARRVVDEELVALGRPELIDDVDIVVTELVVNAVIHARTTIELTIRPAGSGVRVEVSDGSPVIPRWTPAAMSSTSGRGLILVNRMTSAWGVEPHDGGKTVWAVIEQPADWAEDSSFEELLAQWTDDDEPAPAAPSTTEQLRVQLTVDVAQMLDSRAHTEDLVRELQLLVFDKDAAEPPVAVVDLAHRLAAATETFYDGRRQMLTQTLLAAQRNQTDVTLDLHLHRDDEDAARQWLAALDEADSLAQQGALLLPPFPPALVEFRRHYIAIVISRLQEH